MTALPNIPSVANTSATAPQPPELLAAQRPNEGFAQQPEPSAAVYDMLRDSAALQRASMDARGSRQVAPFGSYEAINAALNDGYYTGLEALDFGTLPDGTPAGVFTDQNGQRQVVRMSLDQWTAAMQQRAKGRIEMAQRMRIAEDSKRLGPAIQQMAKAVEQFIPGFSMFAQAQTEREPTLAFQSVQQAYAAVQGKNQAEIAAKQAEVEQFNMDLMSARAQSWGQMKNQEMADAVNGFLNDESIPQDQRYVKAGQVYRDQQFVNYFLGYMPPSPRISGQMSFPTFFSTASPNITALEDLIDMSMMLLGPSNIATYPIEQQTYWVIQKAQDAARNIGWNVPFTQMDIDNLSRVYQRKVQMMGGQNFALQAPGGMNPYQQAVQRGQAGRFQQAQQQAEYESAMSQAELAQKQAAAQKTGAEAQSTQAEVGRTQAQTEAQRAEARRSSATAEQTLTEAALLRGERPVAGPESQRMRVEAFRSAAADAGFDIDPNVPLATAIRQVTARLGSDRSAAGKQRLAEWVRTLEILQTQQTPQ